MADVQPTTDANTTADPSDTPERGSRPGGSPRRWVLAGAGAIAVGLILAVVIVSVTSGDDDGSATTANTQDIASDTPGASQAPAPGAEQTSSFSTVGPFNVNIVPGSDGELLVTVADPTAPSSADTGSQVCVLATLEGPTSVEAYGCGDATTAEMGELTWSVPGSPLLGCAAVATRPPQSAIGSVDALTDLTVRPAVELPAGSYQVSVVAVTGVGDGCAPADEGGLERETTATGQITVGPNA